MGGDALERLALLGVGARLLPLGPVAQLAVLRLAPARACNPPLVTVAGPLRAYSAPLLGAQLPVLLRVKASGHTQHSGMTAPKHTAAEGRAQHWASVQRWPPLITVLEGHRKRSCWAQEASAGTQCQSKLYEMRPDYAVCSALLGWRLAAICSTMEHKGHLARGCLRNPSKGFGGLKTGRMHTR